MKTVFLLGSLALTVFTQMPLSVGISAADQTQPLTMPPHITVSLLIEDRHDPLVDSRSVQN